MEKILSILNEFSYIGDDIVAVGGCVRDTLLEIEYDDIDIASSTTPEEVISLSNQKGIKVFKTGIDHGTVTLKSSTGIMIEHTTFRKDVATDGRNAQVEFADNFYEDSIRRDLTINGLGIDKDGNIIDYNNSVQHLKNKELHFIGDTWDRLLEDNLRAIRALRFAAKYDLSINGITLNKIHNCFTLSDFNENVSTERIFKEFEKTVKCGSNVWNNFLKLAYEVRLFENVFNLKTQMHAINLENANDIDAILHLLFLEETFVERKKLNKFANDLPFTKDQKRRLYFQHQINFAKTEKEFLEVCWNNKNYFIQSDTLNVDFIKNTWVPLNIVSKNIKNALSLKYPENLEGREIGKWQKTKFLNDNKNQLKK